MLFSESDLFKTELLRTKYLPCATMDTRNNEFQPGPTIVPITERANDLARDIDIGTASDIVRTLRRCDAQIFSGWENFPSIYDLKVVSAMERIVEKATEVLQDGSGTIVLSGCGTSGRLAFFLAQKFSQLAKAQHLTASYEYLIAGGDISLFTSQESPEDSWKKGQEDLEEVSCNRTRVLFVGITCGLSAPYVAGQLEYCMSHPDVFIPVLLGFNPVNQARQTVIEGWSKSFFDVVKALNDYDKGIILNPVVGPEAITGSSRMKGGSATKIVLESILLNAHITLSNPASLLTNTPNQILMMFETMSTSTYLESSNISRAIELAAESLQCQGHVYYIGWGSSGFMGLLDASECVPTFSANFDDIRGFLQGGYSTLKNREGEIALDESNRLYISLEDFEGKLLPELTSCDTVVFICPDGKYIPEVRRISQLINKKGAHLIGIVHEKERLFDSLFTKCLVHVKEPSSQGQLFEEILAPLITNFIKECLVETSIKWILNAISTGAHVLKGKVLRSFMIDLKVSNSKLFHRAVSIVSGLARVDQERAWHAVLQSIYRRDVIEDVLDKQVSLHVARGSKMEQVLPVAVLVATDKFKVESALEVLRTNTVSQIFRKKSISRS